MTSTLACLGVGAANAAAAFDPSTITGLQVWFKADAITGLSDGAAVGTWNDSSSNARNATQATGTKQPLYKTAIINGLPIVRFDGTDDFLQTGSFSVAQPFMLFAVITGTGNRYFSSADDAARAGWDPTPEANNYAGAVLVGNLGSPVASATAKVVTSLFNSTSSLIRINGTQVASGDGGTGTIATGVYVGKSLGQEWTGDIAEVLLYNSNLSATDRDNVEGYLKTKYGT